jgi:hypothetical protein
MFDHALCTYPVTLKLEASRSILISSNYVREYLHSRPVVFRSPRFLTALAFCKAPVICFVVHLMQQLGYQSRDMRSPVYPLSITSTLLICRLCNVQACALILSIL